MVLLSASRRISRRLASQLLAFQLRGQVHAEGAEQPPVAGRQDPAGEDQPGGGVDLFHVLAVRIACRARSPGRGGIVAGAGERAASRRRSASRRRPAPARPPSDGLNRAAPRTWKTSRACSSSPVTVSSGAGGAAGEVTERGGFGAGPGGLLGAAGREVHDDGDGGGDAHEDQQGEDVLRIADGQGAHRRGGEVVHQQAAPERGEDRRPEPADQRHGDGSGELDQHGRGDVLVRVQGEQQLQQGRQEQRPGRSPTATRTRPRSRCRRRARRPGRRAGAETMMDVDVAGAADHPGADAAAEKAAEQAGEPSAAGDADDDLGGVDAAGEVQQRGGRVLAGHDVVAAAQVLDQPALGFQRLRRLAGHTVRGADVDRQQVAAVDPVEDPGAAADQDLAFGAAGQPDDDAFPGRPAGLDALFRPGTWPGLRPPGPPATAGPVRAAR